MPRVESALLRAAAVHDAAAAMHDRAAEFFDAGREAQSGPSTARYRELLLSIDGHWWRGSAVAASDENGDEIFFWAGLIKPEGTRAGCGFVKVVRTPRQYECQAEVGIAGPDFAYVAFTVQPGPAGSTRGGGMRNGARPQELIDLGDGRLLAVGHQEGRGSGSGVASARDWATLWTLSAGRIIREQYFFDRA